MLENHDPKPLPESLLSGHKKFLNSDLEGNRTLLARLEAEGQSPKVLWIGCSDSRVPPGFVFEAEPGELFTLRNVGNIVPPFEAEEASIGSAIEYAVNHLKIDHIVVCGHSDCGGIKALSHLGESAVEPMISEWIEYAVTALEDDKGATLESLTKTNAILQAERLVGYPCVADAIASRGLSIHALYHDIRSGEIMQYRPGERSWTEICAEAPVENR